LAGAVIGMSVLDLNNNKKYIYYNKPIAMKKIYLNFYFTVILMFVINSNLNAQCTATSIPFFESFQSITLANQLPNCWAASNMSNTCLTFITPVQRAGFFHSPSGVNYFYSRAIQLQTGITYSAAVIYVNDNNLSNNWTDLSLMLGTSQSPIGLSTIASTGGPVSTFGLSTLSNTFTVANAGQYYIAVRGTSSSTGATQYLYFDDLSVTIPCNVPGINDHTYTLSTSPAQTVCSSQILNFDATVLGPYTHLWFNGATTPSISYLPGSTPVGIFTVVITNTLTTCSKTYYYNINVNPSPNVFIAASSSVICEGDSIKLVAYGAGSYTWTNGKVGISTFVSPTATSIYTVVGSNSFSCSTSATQEIVVNPQPIVTIVGSSSAICLGETLTLTASGASSYSWLPSGTGNTITIAPVASGMYTVVGVNTVGCENSGVYEFAILECTGLSKIISKRQILIYPNPAEESIFFEEGQNSLVKMYNGTGQLVKTFYVDSNLQEINVHDLHCGIYFLTIEDANDVTFKRIQKR